MRLPAGVRDWLPAELRKKRAVEQGIREIFERSAFLEVATPSLERYDVLAFGLGERIAEMTFRLEDRRGTSLGLRPEMTTSIARLVSTRMRDEPLPLRLCYLAPTFRYEEPQEGRMREFTQAGIEIIGTAEMSTDAEAIFLAIEMFDRIGLHEVQFDVNHLAVVDGVLESLGFVLAEATKLKFLLAVRNLVGLEAEVEHINASRSARGESAIGAEEHRVLFELALARGGTTMIECLKPYCRTAASSQGLERLAYLLAQAESRGYGDRVTIDFSLIRELNYYTGIVFEGYISSLGFPICGGGRYDGLLPRFGFDAPAVGWTTGIERLLLALERIEA